jgi:hypothetical protein
MFYYYDAVSWSKEAVMLHRICPILSDTPSVVQIQRARCTMSHHTTPHRKHKTTPHHTASHHITSHHAASHQTSFCAGILEVSRTDDIVKYETLCNANNYVSAQIKQNRLTSEPADGLRSTTCDALHLREFLLQKAQLLPRHKPPAQRQAVVRSLRQRDFQHLEHKHVVYYISEDRQTASS